MWASQDMESRTLSEINVTPFVDVLLVLLVVFMATAPLVQTGIMVNLPKSNAAKKTKDEDKIIVTITQKDGIFLNKVGYTQSQLSQKLAAIYNDRNDKSIYIRADKLVIYKSVIEVMDLAKQAGVVKIGMITDQNQVKKKKKRSKKRRRKKNRSK